MEDKQIVHRWTELPFVLDEDCWGELSEAIEECPGVYYVCTIPEKGEGLGRELYVVTRAATPSIISPEVVAHGIETGEAWVFAYTDAGSVYNLVKYEIMLYRVKHGLPLEEGDGSLYCSAVYCAEHFPWYFGGTIPPRSTPFGLTVRVKKADEGLFFLETDQCRWVLAVSFPIWDSELSASAKRLGVMGSDDLSAQVREARYLFFSKERCAPAVYELLVNPDHKGLTCFIQSKQALETYLWERFPEYALEHNAMEMSGNGGADLLDHLFKSLGAEIPETDEERKNERRIKNCIAYSKELKGQEFLLLP